MRTHTPPVAAQILQIMPAKDNTVAVLWIETCDNNPEHCEHGSDLCNSRSVAEVYTYPVHALALVELCQEQDGETVRFTCVAPIVDRWEQEPQGYPIALVLHTPYNGALRGSSWNIFDNPAVCASDEDYLGVSFDWPADQAHWQAKANEALIQQRKREAQRGAAS